MDIGSMLYPRCLLISVQSCRYVVMRLEDSASGFTLPIAQSHATASDVCGGAHLEDESGFCSVPGPEKLACLCHRHIMFQLFVRLAILGVKTVERCSGMCAAEVCSMKTVATKHLRITDVTA